MTRPGIAGKAEKIFFRARKALPAPLARSTFQPSIGFCRISDFPPDGRLRNAFTPRLLHLHRRHSTFRRSVFMLPSFSPLPLLPDPLPPHTQPASSFLRIDSERIKTPVNPAWPFSFAHRPHNTSQHSIGITPRIAVIGTTDTGGLSGLLLASAISYPPAFSPRNWTSTSLVYVWYDWEDGLT